jgi:hypothetical protein
VEPDYLPDAEVLCFQPCLYPMKYLHPRSMYTLPRGGVQRGGTPSAEYCILREETVRERRGSYNGFCCRFYPFILLDNNKGRTWQFLWWT